MTGWYTITPAGAVAIGNLTPVGQNSGQVGCRWPPNGHHLAACLKLPRDCQLWGPFWYWEENQSIYVTLPLPVYSLVSSDKIPKQIFRMQWHNEQWQVRTEHQGEEIEIVGTRYLISGSQLKVFWKSGQLTVKNAELKEPPWTTLTLSQNSREDFRVKDEGGFFAEMTTIMNSGWSILVKVIGNYTPTSKWGVLGAGGTPVVITPNQRISDEWLDPQCPNPSGAILLTAALWQKGSDKVSIPCPPFSIQGYAADMGVPWQSWKRVRDRRNPDQWVQVLTPGEWITPAGAVYLWNGTSPLQKSAPLPDIFNRHVLGYGHLWLFED